MKPLTAEILRHHQRELLKSDIDNYENSIQYAKPEDKQILIRRKLRTEKQLADGSPEPLTATEKDKLHKLEKKLRDKITENMPSDEVMRKNPPGAIDWHMRWEKANKSLIKMWKNIRLQLNPESQDKDLANIDRYRPSGAISHGLRSDAQIPGHISYDDIPEELWPFEQPTNSALARAQRRYDEEHAENDVNAALENYEIKGAVKEAGFGPSGTLSAEEYAALEERLAKGREVLARKRREQKQLNEAFGTAAPTGDSEAAD